MQTLYPLAQIVHLFCAIAFVGYFLLEVIFLKSLYPKLTPEAKSVFASRKVKFIFGSLFGLFTSGGILIYQILGSEGSLWQDLSLAFNLKIILSFLLLGIVLYWYVIVKLLQKPLPLKKLMHPLSLILVIAITLLSKF